MCRTHGKDLSAYSESLGITDEGMHIGSVKVSKHMPSQCWSNLTCRPGLPSKKGHISYFVGLS